MIIDWLKYIKDNLLISIRNNRVLQFIYVLLSPAETQHSELTAYMNKARLYASCTWQVCWLEYILRQELKNDSITITEGDGLPIDFIISCDNYISENLVSGILNRFKLPGKSFRFNFTSLEYNIQWVNPVCEKVLYVETIQWINPLCARELGPLRVVDYNGLLLNKIDYDSDGSLIYSYASPFAVEYPNESVTCIQIRAYENFELVETNDDCRITINDAIVIGKREITIITNSNLTINQKSWIFQFQSGPEYYELEITQQPSS